MPRKTRRTTATNSTNPLDTNAIADFDSAVLSSSSHLDNLANAFVAADLAGLRGVWQGHPAVGHDAEIRVADAGVRAVVAM